MAIAGDGHLVEWRLHNNWTDCDVGETFSSMFGWG